MLYNILVIVFSMGFSDTRSRNSCLTTSTTICGRLGPPTYASLCFGQVSALWFFSIHSNGLAGLALVLISSPASGRLLKCQTVYYTHLRASWYIYFYFKNMDDIIESGEYKGLQWLTECLQALEKRNMLLSLGLIGFVLCVCVINAQGKLPNFGCSQFKAIQ